MGSNFCGIPTHFFMDNHEIHKNLNHTKITIHMVYIIRNLYAYCLQVFTGFLININSLGAWILWLQYISIFRYALHVCIATICIYEMT